MFNRLHELKAQTGLNDAQYLGLSQAFASHKTEVVEAFINRLKVKAETLKSLRAFLKNLHRHKQVVVLTTSAPVLTTLAPVTTTQATVVDVVPSGECKVVPAAEGVVA